MRFFDRDPSDVLLVDATTGKMVTAGDVVRTATEILDSFQVHLAFLFADQSLGSATRLLALLEANVPVLLLDPQTPPSVAADLVSRYRPELVMAPDDSSPILAALPSSGVGADGVWESDVLGEVCHPDLAVLLSTSGSTGSPKLVRLSRDNVKSNARAIGKSLGLHTDDRALTSLPLFYSFGMSLVTSHLASGSSVVVTARSVLDREFWAEMNEHRATHLAGVPQTYSMLKRLRVDQMHLPHLRGLLQAGGRLSPEMISEFHREAVRADRQFFVMYGQTEASPRMSCLPPDRLPDKLGSVGVALDGGRFTIRDDSGGELRAGDRGEIVYSGSNVMMGYGRSRADLSLGDEFGSELYTGDQGHIDDEGFVYISGRTSRIAKLAGVRVSLDEVEDMLGSIGPVAGVPNLDEGITLYTTANDITQVNRARAQLAQDLGTSYRLLQFRIVSDLPLLPNGKLDYVLLSERRAAGD